jgi:hypothetical protein
VNAHHDVGCTERVGTVARPRIFARVPHHPGPDRVELDVPAAGKEVSFAINWCRAVAALPQRPGAPVGSGSTLVIAVLRPILGQPLER